MSSSRFRLARRPRRAGALLPLLPLFPLALSLAACERRPAAVRADSAVPAPSSAGDSMAQRRVASGWHDADGPALLVPGPSREEAIALYPTADDSTAVSQLDSASMQQLPVALLGRGGATLAALLGAPSGDGSDECERWPVRVVQPDSATTWSVGFVGARVAPMRLDSVDVLSTRDSLTLAAEASRLASTVALPSGPAFQGLRFTASDLRRFEPAPGVQALVARLVRRVNQEANPREEQTLLIAERDSGARAGPYRLAYAERDVGREEAVITPEVLAGVRLGPSMTPTLVVARDHDAGISYRLIERSGAGHWRARWSSGSISCS